MKSLSLKLGLALICVLFGVICFFAPTFINTVNADIADFEERGTSEAPYIIATVEDLVFFRDSINNSSTAPAGKTPYNIAYYKLDANLNLSDDSGWINITGGKQMVWEPVGTLSHPFSGHFNGNGKTISGVNLEYATLDDNVTQGFFGVLNGAIIENLGVSTKAVVQDITSNEDYEKIYTALPKFTVGGLAGKVVNSTISSCKSEFDLQAKSIEYVYQIANITAFEVGKTYYKLNSGEYLIVNDPYDSSTTYYTLELDNDDNCKYNDEIICGGLVGDISDSVLCDSYSQIKINIKQSGTSVINSYFGGIAGFVNNGEIYNVYVAPTQTLIDSLNTKNGVITAISEGESDIKISSEKITSNIVFGGIIGYAKGASLTVYNSVFATIMSSESANKIVRGGIVGQISENTAEQPNTVQYAKYLNIPNANTNIMNFASGIGNAALVGYILSSNVSSINVLPTQTVFTNWAWNEYRAWDYSNTWKTSSIVPTGGYFFPSLQLFSFFNITISGSKEVVTTGGNYSSGYYTLAFEGRTEKTIPAVTGAQIRIIATFYDGNGEPLRDFKNYFMFTDWVKNEFSVGKIIYQYTQVDIDAFTVGTTYYVLNNGEYTIVPNNALFNDRQVYYVLNTNATDNELSDAENQTIATGGYALLLDEENGKATLIFNVSAETEGSYDVKIKGRSVEVNVLMVNQTNNTEEEDLGSIKKIIGNEEETYTNSFSFIMNEYLNDVAVTLTSGNSESGIYIFAGLWADNNSYDVDDAIFTKRSNSRSLIFELNNEGKSTARFYPIVKYDNGQLQATIICYFSNNTSVLTINVAGKGSISVNEGDSKTVNSSVSVINDQKLNLKATANEGYQFDGWYIGGEKVSDKAVWENDFSITEETILEAKFSKIENDGAGLSAWVIALIVIIPLVLGGVITFIIIKIKKNSNYGYKKNYRL